MPFHLPPELSSQPDLSSENLKKIIKRAHWKKNTNRNIEDIKLAREELSNLGWWLALAIIRERKEHEEQKQKG
jgi:hypothetical protein